MLIRCPECGHQVSEKAPLCPNCGVEIAGNISVCQQCGTKYISGTECPSCGSKEYTESNEPVVVASPIEEKHEIIAEPIVEPMENVEENEFEEIPTEHSKQEGIKKEKESRTSTLVVSLLIATLICGIGLYFYKDATERMGNEQLVNQDVKDTLIVEPVEEIQTRFEDTITNSQPVIEENAEEETVLPKEETDKAEASEKEPTGITDSEKEKAVGSVRKFLRAINSRSKDALLSSTASTLSSFNGKSNATKKDVIQYMIDTYQADVKELTWRIDEVVQVTKNDKSDGNTEYEVTILATREVSRDGGDSKHKFNIKATVNENGLISATNITRK